MSSQLNDLKSQHIADEVKKVEDKVNENKKEIIFVRGFFSYEYHSDLVYDCKLNLIKTYSYDILEWKPKNIYVPSNKNVLNSVQNIKTIAPNIKNDGKGLYVLFNGNYFIQDIITIPNNVINIYCVYELQPKSSSRDDTFTIQNALFGAMQITKNDDTSKYKYKGYGICFDEGGTFSKGNINNGRNVLIFGVHESSLVHANNKANSIYVMSDLFVQGINDTTLYAEKIYSQNFTQPSKKLVLSLHYNGKNSYLFVNGEEELKFKTKTNQIIQNNLCLDNLSNDWTKDEPTNIYLYIYGNIYDFVVDYKAIVGTTTIYDMHRYLMIKHNITT